MIHNCIVWDFNGTIIDDVRVGIDSVNPLLSARGLKTIDSLETYRRHFDFPIKDYYVSLGFDFDAEPYEKIAHEWVENYKNLSHTIKPVNGVCEAIKFFHEKGLKQIILSASERDMLENKLEEIGVSDYFEAILALDNIYAHSKLEIAKEYFKDKDKSGFIMVGDTTHDAFVAREVGIDAVLVCGHHGREKLEKEGFPVCDDMISFVRDIKAGKLMI